MVLLKVKKSNADVYELLNKLNRKYGLEYFQCFGTPSDAAWDFEITQDEYGTLREGGRGYAHFRLEFEDWEIAKRFAKDLPHLLKNTCFKNFKLVYYRNGNEVGFVVNQTGNDGRIVDIMDAKELVHRFGREHFLR